MKVFFDTNVLVAAYATHGACNELLNHCLARHIIYTSDFVLRELEDKLLHKIKLTSQETDLILAFLRRNCEMATDTGQPTHISRDRDDDHVLAAAAHAHVDCILTGDEDLLVLKVIEDIPVLRPRDFWKMEMLK